MKIYVCNVMTQEGETEGYTASDHIRALFNHSCPGLFDLCLVNDAPIPPSVMRGYTREGAEPILCDRDACEALGVEVITRPVSTVENGLVRHNPGHLAWELVRLHAQRNIRLVEDSLRRTPRNRVEKWGRYAVICGKGKKRAVPGAGAAPVLRGLRRAALRQYLQPHRGAAHYRER